MTIYRTVTISRPSEVAGYHALLRDTVFPLVDDLKEMQPIEGFEFLTHSGLDLRLWIAGENALEEVKSCLRERDLPADLKEAAPAETDTARDHLLDVLQRNAEQVRALLSQETEPRRIEDVVHWLLNQWGLSNRQEVEWHFRQACGWLHTLNAAARRTDSEVQDEGEATAEDTS